MLGDALLIARKDLLIELRSKVLTTQLLPFGMIVLILFGFGLSPDRTVPTGVPGESRPLLAQVAPGLFWLAVFFSALLAFSRAFAVEAGDGNLDAHLFMSAMPYVTEEMLSSLCIAYHSDGQTHGHTVGAYGQNAHVQLCVDVPPEDSELWEMQPTIVPAGT